MTDRKRSGTNPEDAGGSPGSGATVGEALCSHLPEAIKVAAHS
jgi:hypothetical protein